MSTMLIIPENLLALPEASVTSGSDADTTMAGANVLSEDPSEFWRSLTNTPDDVELEAGLNDYIAIDASAVALVGHNLYHGDQYRIILNDATSISPAVDMKPTGTISATNATGSHGADFHLDVDEFFTLDAEWITPTAGTDWAIRFSFNSPGSDLVAMASGQAFWLYIRAASTVSYGSRAPTVKCELFETGGATAVADLGTKTIKSTTGQWVFFPWNASLLAAISGAAVEVQLTFAGHSAGRISGYPAGHLNSVVWRPERMGPVGVHDSGWLTYTPFTGTGVTHYPVAQGDSADILYVVPAEVSTLNAVLVYFRSDHSPADYDWLSEVLPTPPGYVELGVLMLGETWSPTRDIQNGPFIGTHDASSKGRTYGGQSFGSRRYVQRVLSMPLTVLTPAEAHTLFDRVIWRHGILKKFFVALMPGDATEGKHTGFLASLKNADHAMLTTPAEYRNRSMTLEFEEEI